MLKTLAAGLVRSVIDMEETEKMPITLYRLNDEAFNFKEFDKMVDWVMDADREQNKQLVGFKEQEVRTFDGFYLRLFYSQKTRKPVWRDFLTGVALPSSKIINASNEDASFIAFIGYNNNLFAISGGQGNFIIQPYIDQNFGLDIICRILPQNHNAIKSIQDVGVFGSILGTEKFFRGDYRLDDEEQFGKVYKSVISGIDKQIIIDEFGFPSSELKRNPRILAKSSFQISRSIDFDNLLEIIKRTDSILARNPNFILNKITHINRRGIVNKQLIETLNIELIQYLFEFFTGNGDDAINICHRNISKYLNAICYEVKAHRKHICSLETIDNIIHLANNSDFVININLNSVDEFRESIEKISILSFDEEGNQLTKAYLLEHCHGELTYNNTVYFFLDGEWYRIEDEFIDGLNEEMSNLIAENLDNSILTDVFDLSVDEKDFNQQYLNDNSVFVLDKVIADGIEICDLLKTTSNQLYIIHVKKGFNNSIRELTSQVALSANTLLWDTKKRYPHVKKLDSMLNSSKTGYLSTIYNQAKPSQTLLEIFNKKKFADITFCLAFVDTATSDRDIKDIRAFHSNIAKFSIIELRRKIKGLGFNFKLIQLKRP